MASVISVTLPEALHDWVEAQAESGRYADAGEYLRELIRRDQDRRERITAQQAATRRRERIDAMQRLVDEAFESGPAEPFELGAFLAERRVAHGG